MKKYNFLFVIIIINIIFSSCKDNDHNLQKLYNEKANSLIMQILKNNDCNCLLEVPQESIIELFESKNSNIRESFIKKLDLKNNSNLDSLLKISQSFVLDTQRLEQNKIYIFKREKLKSSIINNDYSIFEKCDKGVMSIKKPILNNSFQKALIDSDFAFVCIQTPISLYEFKNGNWIENKNN
jgi:hypothetical protein